MDSCKFNLTIWEIQRYKDHSDPTILMKDVKKALIDGVRCIAFKPDQDSLFLVGTEEGDIHLCSTKVTSQFMMTFKTHVTPINKIVWSGFYNNLFLSCATEYKVLLWHK